MPFGLRAKQVNLLRCPAPSMLEHGLRRFALQLHPRRPQRGPRDFHHGLLGNHLLYPDEDRPNHGAEDTTEQQHQEQKETIRSEGVHRPGQVVR